jgi:hypothetical protein
MFISGKDRLKLKQDVATLLSKVGYLEKEVSQLNCNHKEFEYDSGISHWSGADTFYKRCKDCGKVITFSSEEKWLESKIDYEENKLKEGLKESKKQLKEIKRKGV